MIEKLNVKKFKIIIQGQSLGTVAAIHLASIHKVAGVILVSPFLKLINHFKSGFFNKHG
jgi:pimeloyl-ACP methyl ester carboxylesterase